MCTASQIPAHLWIKAAFVLAPWPVGPHIPFLPHPPTTPQDEEVNLDLCKQRRKCNTCPVLFLPLLWSTGPRSGGGSGASRNSPRECPPLGIQAVAQASFTGNALPFTCFISQRAELQDRLESWREESHLTEVETEALGISAVLVVEVTWGPRLPEAKWSDLLQRSVTLPWCSFTQSCVCALRLACTA